VNRIFLITIFILFLQSTSYSQTRDQILKYGIEKVVITRKSKIDIQTTTLFFDKKGNKISEHYLNASNKGYEPENGSATYNEFTSYYYDDTLCTKAIFKADNPELPGTFIIDTTLIQRKFNSNGQLYLEIHTSSAISDHQWFTYYNKNGLKDTFRVFTNVEYKGDRSKKRIAFDDFYIREESIYTYDSLKRLKTEYVYILADWFREPITHKYSYHNDTVSSKEYTLKNNVLIPNGSYKKSYATRNYRYQETVSDITEVDITNNTLGLPVKEKEKHRTEFSETTYVETTYKYYFRKPKKNDKQW